MVARHACCPPITGGHNVSRGTRMIETSSLASSSPRMVPDDRRCDQAPASETGRPRGADPRVGDGGRASQSPPAVGTQGRRRWQRSLTWGSLGLLVSGVGGMAWLSRQPSRMPPRPPHHSDFAASARPGAALPAAHPPTQGQSPTDRASLVGPPPGLPHPSPPATLARGAAPRAGRVGPPSYARQRHAPPRPRLRARAPQEGASRSGTWSATRPAPPPSARWSAPTPAPQGERPWLWHSLPATGDG